MAKKKAGALPCVVCGSGFPERELTKIPLPKPSWDARICKPCRERVLSLETPAGGGGLKNQLRVFVSGDSDEDLGTALDEVARLVDEGYTSGHNENDTGAFSFDIQVRG